MTELVRSCRVPGQYVDNESQVLKIIKPLSDSSHRTEINKKRVLVPATLTTISKQWVIHPVLIFAKRIEKDMTVVDLELSGTTQITSQRGNQVFALAIDNAYPTLPSFYQPPNMNGSFYGPLPGGVPAQPIPAMNKGPQGHPVFPNQPSQGTIDASHGYSVFPQQLAAVNRHQGFPPLLSEGLQAIIEPIVDGPLKARVVAREDYQQTQRLMDSGRKIESQRVELAKHTQAAKVKDGEIAKKDTEIARRKMEITKRDQDIATKEKEIVKKQKDIKMKECTLAKKDKQLAKKDT
ncbi:hypothetical protein CPB83DRAFT_834629 [Crepidotus variabilis]|uniref:Uncharacterized protein n=1 Tax=Crepidotus variabilis TaxID=179855 RepID=A0A9P6JRM8_9AGAR|nr:hypothetical protein CPB83DRAFT_834629 [Crepidotus variabilis]